MMTINPSTYVSAHAAQPNGRRSWRFSASGAQIETPDMPYGPAARLADGWFRYKAIVDEGQDLTVTDITIDVLA